VGLPHLCPDLAAVILEIVRVNSDACGIYNFTNEGKITWYDFAHEIYRLTQNSKLRTQNCRNAKFQDLTPKNDPQKALKNVTEVAK